MTNRQKIVDLYNEGYTVAQIATEVGRHKSRIYQVLHAENVELRNDRLTLPGAPRREFCMRELHRLMNEDGSDSEHVRIDKQGRRNCIPCERFRWNLRHALAGIGS